MALVARADDSSNSVSDWDELYVKLRPNLMRALVAISGSYDGVEDSIQDAFIQGISAGSSRIQSVEPWLFTVALNCLRRSRRRSRLFRPFFRDRAGNERELDRVLDRHAARAALLRLGERERALLIAKYYVGLSQDEIARLMNMRRGTVSAAISRAVAQLRASKEVRE